MNAHSKSPCSACAIVWCALVVVIVAAAGCVATAAWPPTSATIRLCGGVAVLIIFIAALAWAFRGRK